MVAFAQDLLEILCCPKCKGEVKLVVEPSGFSCAACQLLFPIVDDIPDFLLEDARPFTGGGGAPAPSEPEAPPK